MKTEAIIADQLIPLIENWLSSFGGVVVHTYIDYQNCNPSFYSTVVELKIHIIKIISTKLFSQLII